MKVLVSTMETQGQRENDFNFVPEGELVVSGSECDGEAVDGYCGCRRSLSGIESHKGATTFKVVEMELTPSGFADKVYASLKDAGWITEDTPRHRRWAQQEADLMIEIAEGFEIGDIVERRQDFQKRA